MRVLFLDFESYWTTDYSLSKMSPGEYISDPRFELISVSVSVYINKVKQGKTLAAFGIDAIRALLVRLKVEESMVVGHNMSGFDALILVWILKLTARIFACTLAMARAVVGHQTNLGLGALVKFFGIGFKNDAILHATRGKRLKDFTRAELMQMYTYNCDDTDQCAELFWTYLVQHFTWDELFILDCTIRARVFPELEVNIPLLEQALVAERSGKRSELIDLAEVLGLEADNEDDLFELIRARLSSPQKFTQLLIDLGVDPPYKPSPKNPENLIPALAKTDEQFQELLDSEDPIVAAAAQARISIKSTLLETRIGRLITARRTAVALPCPYKYYGAKVSGRHSGEEYNMQNLPRIIARRPRNSDALRRCIEAPPGHLIGVADQSGIELRVSHFLWMAKRSTSLWLQSPTADLYKDYAAVRNNVAIEDVTDVQRQGGKVSHLQLQFGSGAVALQRSARVQFGLKLSIEDCETDVYTWRDTYFEIVQGWAIFHEALNYMQEGIERPLDPGGLCHTVKDGIVLPSGRILRYPNLRRLWMKDPVTGREKLEWVYGQGRFTRRIYGPKSEQNTVQAIARDSIFYCAAQFFQETGRRWRWKLMTHDELGYVWPESEAEELLAILQRIMRTPPKWWPGIVLWSAGGVAKSYAEAK